MSAQLCGVPYRRPDGTLLRCHYLPGHPVDRHSWFTVSVQDRVDSADPSVHNLLDLINNGRLDGYLEAILAATHGRKRALRGEGHPYGVTETGIGRPT